jgi:hypothetical protein
MRPQFLGLLSLCVLVLLIPTAILHAQNPGIGLAAVSTGFSSAPTLSAGALLSSLGQITGPASAGSLHRLEGGFLPAMRSLAGQLSTATIGLQGGWNLVSVPLTVSDYAKTTLFPTSTSQAFAYQGGYLPQALLGNGNGYWLKFGSAQTVLMTGLPLARDSIAVLSGWNLIGSISTPLPVGNVGSIPGGIVTSQFFGYTGSGYAISSTIDPGKGYWVKVSQNGTLVISSSSPADTRIRIVPTSEMPPAPPGTGSVAAAGLPAGFGLEQNYPNPFNPATTIRFAIPAQGGDVGTRHAVSLQVFDLLGQRVATLVNDVRGPGVYTVTFPAEGGEASHLASGIYIYRLTAGNFSAVKRMILLR